MTVSEYLLRGRGLCLAFVAAVAVLLAAAPGAEAAGPDFEADPAQHDFGVLPVGGSDSRQFTVTNVGDATLEIDAVSMMGGYPEQFDLDASGCEFTDLEPSQSCTVEVTFAPAQQGTFSAFVGFFNNAESLSTITVFGEGVMPPVFTASSEPFHDFGPRPVGSMTQGTITISNSGGYPLEISGVAVSGANAEQFSVESNSCNGATLEGDDTCEVTVRFQPTSTGAKEASLDFTTDWGSPSVGLQGLGHVPNDYLATAQELMGTLPIVVGSTNVDATTEPEEPAGRHSSVWFRWTATIEGTVDVTLSDDSFDGVVTVLEGDDWDDATEIASDLDGTSFQAEKGKTYSISVDGGTPGNEQAFGLTLSAYAGEVNGTVTNTAGDPLPGRISVYLRRSMNGENVGLAFTDSAGRYEFENVVAGDYYVVFVDINGEYRAEFYDDELLEVDADHFAVPSGGSVTADASLDLINSPPINLARPTISGTLRVGRTLTAQTGSWSHDPTGFAYRWLRCTGADYSTCVSIGNATSSIYTLRPADRDDRVRVRVTAMNGNGSRTAVSPTSRVVRP